MRFSSTVESLGVSLVSSVMTLIAFLPVLLQDRRQHHRTAADRRSAACARLGGALLVDLRHGLPAGSSASSCRDLNSATSVSKRPTARSSFTARTMPTARTPPTVGGALRQCAAELLPPLFPLHVFQRRPHLLPAGGQPLQPDRARSVDRRRQADATASDDSRSTTSSIRCATPSSISSIPGRRSSSCCRSTSACVLRIGDRRRAAAGYRPALSGARSGYCPRRRLSVAWTRKRAQLVTVIGRSGNIFLSSSPECPAGYVRNDDI